MIKNFNEFVNESTSTQKIKFSNFDEINEPFVDYIRQEEIRIQQEQEDLYKTQEYLEDILRYFDLTMQVVMRDFEDVIVGDPTIKIEVVKQDEGECEVKAIFNTNVPYEYTPTPEEQESGDFEDPGSELDDKAMARDQHFHRDVRVYLGPKNDEGNCTIEVFVDNLYVD